MCLGCRRPLRSLLTTPLSHCVPTHAPPHTSHCVSPHTHAFPHCHALQGEGMSFVEAVFSFVFGDGDPNENWAERRFRALGAHIQKL